MNILILDSQGILNCQQSEDARERIETQLRKLETTVYGLTLHLAIDKNCTSVKCAINADVEQMGVVTARHEGGHSVDVIDQALDSISRQIQRYLARQKRKASIKNSWNQVCSAGRAIRLILDSQRKQQTWS